MEGLGQALEGMALAEMVGSFALGVAQAQHELDLAALRAAEVMSGQYTAPGGERREAKVGFMGEKLSLLELGFQPAFYQFTETVMEVKVSYSMSREQAQETRSSETTSSSETRTRRSGFLGLGGSTTTTTTRVTSVDARFASRFAYKAEGAGSVAVRMVPAPPPALLMERLQALSEEAA